MPIYIDPATLAEIYDRAYARYGFHLDDDNAATYIYPLWEIMATGEYEGKDIPDHQRIIRVLAALEVLMYGPDEEPEPTTEFYPRRSAPAAVALARMPEYLEVCAINGWDPTDPDSAKEFLAEPGSIPAADPAPAPMIYR